MRVALATCRRLPEPDPDADLLLDALRARGTEARWLAWDDPGADFSAYDACVIRSTWNYIHHLPRFLAWARATARRSRLLNPFPIIRWNTDKSYLASLARRGVPVVPTRFGTTIPRDWPRFVVKPRVGAGSFLTRAFSQDERSAAERFLKACRRPMMVQPYVDSVDDRGERCLVWIDGAFTHAVRKSPRFSDDQESVSLARVSAEERAFGERVLAPYAKHLLYGRVDLARDGRGRLALMELELVEPSLFLAQCPRALDRLARACLKLH